MVVANRPGDSSVDTKLRIVACPSCKNRKFSQITRKPKESMPCDFARFENGECKFGSQCDVCSRCHLFCPDCLELGKYLEYLNDTYNSAIGAPDSLQRTLRAMSGLHTAYDKTAALIEEQKKILALLAESFNHKLDILREIGRDPITFLENIVPSMPDKLLGLPEWTYLASLMKWDSFLAFDTQEKYEAFLNTLVHIAVADKDSPEAGPSRSKSAQPRAASSPAPARPVTLSVPSRAPSVGPLTPVPAPSPVPEDEEELDVEKSALGEETGTSEVVVAESSAKITTS
ncbi:hypothetical protein BDP27DRAFT_1365604 [Rhodocollybia butyracea]|uniref:Uncharacterized protein n=1 Tax=Rhodocollybia butyracea TaxID=206335 RepID=A0A9P5PNA0_9AGAR|nr:hypothetical protein BDP27DRAFT_1365604 [Rhodocollybia butyracea]